MTQQPPPWGNQQSGPAGPHQPQGGGWSGAPFTPSEPPPSEPPAKSRKFWRWLAPLLAVIVAAAVVVPLVLTSGDDSPSATNPTGQNQPPSSVNPNWVVQGKDVPPYQDGINTWLVGDTLVIARNNYITAYARTDGSVRWKTDAPTGLSICGSSTAAPGDQIVLGLSTAKEHCDTAAVLNAKTGKFGWQQPLKVPQGSGETEVPSIVQLEIVGNTIFVAQEQGIAGLDLATGQQKWGKPLSHGTDQTACKTLDMLPQGPSVLVLLNCYTWDYTLAAQIFDPTSGEITKQHDFTKDEIGITVQRAQIASTEPMVFFIEDSEINGGYIFYDEDFKEKSVINAEDERTKGSIARPYNEGFGKGTGLKSQHNNFSIKLVNNLLITTTSLVSGSNSVDAYDITTAKATKKWSAEIPGGIIEAPVEIQGDSVIVVATPTERTGSMQVAKVNIATGALTPVGSYPIKNSEGFAPLVGSQRFYWADNRIYGVTGPPAPHGLEIYAVG